MSDQLLCNVQSSKNDISFGGFITSPAQIVFSPNVIFSLQKGCFLSSLGSIKLRELILISKIVYQFNGTGKATKQSIISDIITFISKHFRCIEDKIWRGWEDDTDTEYMTSLMGQIYTSASDNEVNSYFTNALPSNDDLNAMSLRDWNLEGLRSLQDVLFLFEEDVFIVTERSIQLRELLLHSRTVYQLRGTGESTRQSIISDMIVFISKSFMSLEGYHWSVWNNKKDAEHMTKVLQRIYTSLSDDDVCKYFIDASEIITRLSKKVANDDDEEEDKALFSMNDTSKTSNGDGSEMNGISSPKKESSIDVAYVTNTSTQQKFDINLLRLLKRIVYLAGARVSCPTLFWLVPENSRSHTTKASLREWLIKSISKRWLLYFVCAHDQKPVGPPIELKCTRDWLKKVAPALKLMLIMNQLTLKTTASLKFDLSVIQLHSGAKHDDWLEAVIEFTNSLLGAEVAKIIDRRALEWKRDGISSDDFDKYGVIQQFGPDMQLAFDAIAAKAKENTEWKRHMKQVPSKEGLVWVRNQHAKYYKSYA